MRYDEALFDETILLLDLTGDLAESQMYPVSDRNADKSWGLSKICQLSISFSISRKRERERERLPEHSANREGMEIY